MEPSVVTLGMGHSRGRLAERDGRHRPMAALAYRPHTQKPDCDNIAKAICDGLNRIAWADDRQICAVKISKAWGPNDQTTIFVEAEE